MPSPILTKQLPVDPESDSYSIALPTRFLEDGNIATVSYPKSVPLEEALADIHANNPRDAADTHVEYMLDPEYRKNMPFEDFKEWKNVKRKLQGTEVDMSYMDLAVDAAKAVAKGAGQTAVSVLGYGSTDLDIKKQASNMWNAVEAGLQGTERLFQLGKMAAGFAAKQLTFNTDATDEVEYWLYQQENNLVDTMQKRSSGELITSDMRPSQMEAPTKEDIADINSMANFLDASLLVPPLGIAEKIGAKLAANSIARNILPKVIAGEILPKLAFGAAEYTGKALDYGTKLVLNGVVGTVEKLAEAAGTGAVSPGAQYLARKAAVIGFGLTDATSGLVAMSAAGKFGLRPLGEMGGAMAKAMAEGAPVRGALREVAQTSSSDVVRAMARGAVKIAPPEAFFDGVKHIASAAFDTGMFMGTLGMMEASAAQDDPIHGFMEGFASGAGAGTMFGAVGARGAAKGAKVARLAEYFDNDIRGRQPQAAIDINGQQVRINDLDGRVALFNRDDLTPEQKGFILSLTQAHEKSGNSVYFHDGSPEMLATLEAAGIGAGEGVQFFDGPEGRSTVIMDASALSPGTAVEEVFHGMVSDSVIKEIGRNINLELKAATAPEAAVDPTLPTYAPRRSAANKARGQEMLNDLQGFADRYIDLLEKSGTESGRAKAAEYRSLIYRVATDPNMMPDIKADILTPILNEYGANYARAKLAGMRLPNLMDGNIRNLWDNLWDKTMGNLLSSFDASKIGAMKDPITGHFFNEKGKRVINPTLERMVDRYIEAASEGRREIPAENTTSGTYYFDVRSDKPFVSYEDMIDGKQTTESQKKKIHNAAFKSNAAWLNANSPVDHVVLVTDRLKYDGAFQGNITKMKSGKDTLIFTQTPPEGLFDHAAREGQISAEQAKVHKLMSRAMQAGQIVMVDSWADIGKHKGDRSLVYYGRGNRAFLPISYQQGPTGGLTVSGLDVTRVWNYAQRASKKVRAVREEFKSKGIDSMQEFLPYMQRYFDNYSSENPIPAAELKDFSPTMRDVISMALSDSIGIRDYFRAEDEGKFQNLHTFSARLVGSPEASVVTKYRRGDITHAEMNRGLEAKGARQRVVPLGKTEAEAVKAVKMARDSVSLLQIRADRILGLSDFSINSAPFAIKYNPYKVTNLVRANFSPGRTINEKIGDSQVITDAVNGKRMIVKPTGKVTLFDGENKSIHDSVEEAQDFANKRTSKLDDELSSSEENALRVITSVDELQFSNLDGKYFVVPDQKQLDAMKAELPAHSSKVRAIKNKLGTVYGVSLFDKNSKEVGYSYTAIYPDKPNELFVEATFIEEGQRKKGYGQALYREIAKVAQSLGATKLTSSSTSPVAARVRAKIVETNWGGDYLAAESYIPSDVSFAPKRKKDAIESTDNAFNDPTNSLRALSDKAARLYRDGHLEIGELNKILVTLNQRQGKSTTEARKEAALFVADAVRGLKPEIIQQEKAPEVELPAEEPSNVTYEGMTRDEAVTLKLLNKNGTVSLSKIRKYNAEKAREQRELERIDREKNAEVEALAREVKKKEEQDKREQDQKDQARQKELDAAKRAGEREYEATTKRIEKMIRDDNEKAYLEREKEEKDAEKLMEKYRAKARKERAKTMETLFKEQDQSYDAYVKEFLAQDDLTSKQAAAAGVERRKAGEQAEVVARKQRTAERAMDMKSLLEARDAQAAEDAATVLKFQNRLADQQTAMQDIAARKAEARELRAQEQPARVEDIPPISDPRIPNNVRIIFTPARKYRVYYSDAGLVGVVNDFDSALKLSQKYAAR